MQGASHLAQQHHMLYGDPGIHAGIQQNVQLGQQQQQQQHGAPFDPENPKHAGLAKLAELRECVDDVSKDALKFFEKGNKAAGVRARKKLQTLKALAQELRVSIQKCKAELASTGGAGEQGHHDDDGDGLGA